MREEADMVKGRLQAEMGKDFFLMVSRGAEKLALEAS